jgi:hypothetical protein
LLETHRSLDGCSSSRIYTHTHISRLSRMSFPIRHDSRKKKKASSFSASTASAVPRTTSFCLHIPLQAMSNPTEDFDCPTGLCPPPTNPLNPNNPAPVTSAMASSSSAPPGSSSTSAYPTDTTPSTNETPTTNPAPVTSSSTPSIENPKPQDQSDPALLDPSTFVQPLVENLPGWRIVIEFCDRCRCMLSSHFLILTRIYIEKHKLIGLLLACQGFIELAGSRRNCSSRSHLLRSRRLVLSL